VAHVLAGHRPARLTVVDLDDLEDHKLRLKARVTNGRRRLVEVRNATAWASYQRTLVEQVNAVTVCNEADRTALAAGNCYVVPNGFPEVEPHVESDSAGATVLLVGLFEYGPNADAAEFFVNEILPLIRAAIPAAAVRLVGRASPRVRRLSGEGVEIVGEVPDLGAEYARAAVAIAPIRFGSGTRVKILEAFARQIPVVSTTMGAAGLGTRHGEHLLLADEPASFAHACITVMKDQHLRRRLVANASDLYEKQFGQSAVTRCVGQVLNAVGCLPALVPAAP
jgi:glycosyltransferase involved in cell wall biosynthesis